MKRYFLILALPIICLVTQIESVQAVPIILDMKAVVTDIIPADFIPGIGLGDTVSFQYTFDPNKYDGISGGTYCQVPDYHSTLESPELGFYGESSFLTFHIFGKDSFMVGADLPGYYDFDPSIVAIAEFNLLATTDIFTDVGPGSPHPEFDTFAKFELSNGQLFIRDPVDYGPGIACEITEATFHSVPIPEPATLLLLGVGLVVMTVSRKRKRG